MSKIKEMLKNDLIQVTLGLGTCIILIALANAKLLNMELSYLEVATPGIIFIFYEVIVSRKVAYKFKRPLLWNILIFGGTGLVVFYNYLLI